ncbi:MAG: GNAT family N-acetyltransferase [Oscillospiraceae bacterium]|nr:GNAT family N-acetyltransferase [Oscillospiraceae bacterium]
MERAAKADFDSIFKIMAASFPPDERRPYEEEKRKLGRENCRVFVERADGIVVGFMVTWLLDDFSYLEHFAVDESRRGGGIGARMLSELLEILPKPVLLEVDPPETDTARRRIAFYERFGFRLNDRLWHQPPLAPGQGPVELRIMTVPDPVSDELWDIIVRELTRLCSC